MRTISQPKEVRAKKAHNCDLCNGTIAKNQKYIKSTHEYDGDIYDWKTHAGCNKLADDLNMYEDCDEGLTGEDFVEVVSQKHHDILIGQLEKETKIANYSDIVNQLNHVMFLYKLKFVIRYVNKQIINDK